MTISSEAIEQRARRICWEAGIDPDFMAYEGQDDLGYAIREPNWKQWAEQAEDELLAELPPSTSPPEPDAMSTTTHQGAVGAETMTAGPTTGFIYVAPDGEPFWPSAKPSEAESRKACFGPCDEWRLTDLEREGWRCEPITLGAKDEESEAEIDARIERLGDRENMRLIDRISDLIGLPHNVELTLDHVREALAQAATPAPRTDGGMTAGEDVPLEAVRGILKDTATPAQPAGAVPDSLRALSEAASEDWDTNEATPYILGPPIDGDIDRFEVIARGPHGYAKNGDDVRKWRANRMFAVAAVKHVRTLLASHPARQCAGSGAETVQPVEFATDAELHAVLGLEEGEEPEADDLGEIRTCSGAWKRFTGWRFYEDEGLCLHRVVVEPAPDSTRTGQAEADARLIGPKMTPEQEERIGHNLCGEFGPEAVIANAAFAKAFYSELYAAARPAAPEAQGAERVRHVKRGTEYEVLGEAEAQISTQDSQSAKVCGEGRRILREGVKLTVYRCVETGKLWCRFADEFRDGRFVPAPPASSGQGGR